MVKRKKLTIVVALIVALILAGGWSLWRHFYSPAGIFVDDYYDADKKISAGSFIFISDKGGYVYDFEMIWRIYGEPGREEQDDGDIRLLAGTTVYEPIDGSLFMDKLVYLPDNLALKYKSNEILYYNRMTAELEVVNTETGESHWMGRKLNFWESTDQIVKQLKEKVGR